MENLVKILEIGLAFSASAVILGAWLAAQYVYRRRRTMRNRRNDYRRDVFDALVDSAGYDNAVRMFAVYPDIDEVIEDARQRRLNPILTSLIIRKSDGFSRQFAREIAGALNSADAAGSKERT